MGKVEERLISKKRLSMLITIIHREKIDYYVDALQQFDINMQMVVIGNGTSKTTVFVDEKGTKALLFSIIEEDKIKPALAFLEEKFNTLRDGKGVAFTVPLTSVMGVQLFNFLSNNKKGFF